MSPPTRPRLLVIYYNFPPVKVPGALRIHNLCRAAAAHFNRIYGLTTTNRRLLQQDPDLAVPGVPLSEVPAWDLRRLALLRPHSKGQPYVSGTIKTSFLGKLLRRLVDSFPFNILVGDGGFVYILQAYREGRRLVQREGITHIFSTFRPYSDHVIGHLLKRRFPELIWIADFRDLHVDPITKSTFFPGFQRWCNRQILKRADLVTTVSAGLEKHLAAIHPRTRVLYNGILQIQEKRAVVHKTDTFTIVYTGSLFYDHRDPRLLFGVLREMLVEYPRKIELIYAGKEGAQWQDMIEQFGLTRISKNLGLVSLAEARNLQRNATVNLLLTYNSPELQGNLTGKIYEYFAARRPVIALVKGEPEPELESIMAAVKGGIVVYNDAESRYRLKNFLEEQYLNWAQNGSLPDRIDAEGLDRFYWPSMVDRLMEHLHV